MRRFLAFEIQDRESTGLPKGFVTKLARVTRDDPSQASPALKPGGRLIREWNGVTHVVDVVGGGFLWNGQRYASLSPIARAITGARWSGPRFFRSEEVGLTMNKSRIRCAIYTRKSSDEGLDQDSNFLDAQAEACAAYIASQRHEGWVAGKTRYDDGGISGGTLDRPGLQRLLADIDAGRVQMVVVYKIDRLTRSLADFAKLVERLDAAGCSFVSVTQAFKTASSMGRLTLKVLLSFAQFEREVTAERIRDKIAASKKKGLWMGGVPPLGYDPHPDPKIRGLVVNAEEAEIVRTIFALYDELGCLNAVMRRASEIGLRSKRHRFKSGRIQGGNLFSRGQIYAALRNPIYIGKIRHKSRVWDGQHVPILARRFGSGSRRSCRLPVHNQGVGRRLAVSFPATDFTYEAETDAYRCPGGKELRPYWRNISKGRPAFGTDGFKTYYARKQDCAACPLKPRCTPNQVTRKIARSRHEAARQRARDIARTDAYVASSYARKKVEMLFAHLKRIIGLDRLRLGGPNGAKDEFLLAATVQNLRKLAKLRPIPA